MSLKEDYWIININQEIESLVKSVEVGELSSPDNLMYSLHYSAATITV